MSSINIEVPNLGESIQEAVVSKWLANDGALVQKGDVILELESDKANVEIHAPGTGMLHIKAQVGGTVKIGNQVGEISDAQEAPKAPPEKPQEKPVEISSTATPAPPDKEAKVALDQSERTEEMSPFMKAMAKTLLKGQQESVATTTYTDVDLSKVISIREKRQSEFTQKFGVKLGLMSFFGIAVISALNEFPLLNARLKESKIIFNKKIHLGIAVSREQGLIVPVIKNCNEMSYAELEKAISEKVEKVSKRSLDLSEVKGGTFTITNGGMFGSLFSTPLLNPPQVGILGMHRIDHRPVAIKSDKNEFKLEIRPMMYLALTYDHRLVEGKIAVQFLARIKEVLENVDENRILPATVQ